jgi:CheY-like chemotaxis protein
VIRSSGGDLLKLLNDILDLAKVESKTVNLEISELPLAELRDSMIHSFHAVADGQGLAFSVDLDRKLPATIVTDPHRLRQVLKNLLANAFKFTEQGEVALRLDLSAHGWSPDSARLARAESVIAISVRDTGIGIKRELQAAMFEAFAQADGTSARQYGGTGLGLSISRDLVDLLGGEITLVSEPGKGSTFTVYLPLEPLGVAAAAIPPTSTLLAPPPRPPLPASAIATAAGDAAPAAAESLVPLAKPLVNGNGLPPDAAASSSALLEADHPAPHPPGGDAFYTGAAAGTTVLIVDDDFRNIFALTALLERGKLNVVAAESGPAALAMLDQGPKIDIVLMDIMMPAMNGYETMAAIRKRPAYAELPIIAVTGKVVGSERERCIAAGASGYISKPVDTGELLTALRQWLPTTPPSQPPA